MIGVDYDDDDARIKYGAHPQTTREYFAQLGDALAKSQLEITRILVTQYRRASRQRRDRSRVAVISV